MFDPISDTPLVLAYVFMSLLVLIVCFILVNVVHKLYGPMGEEGVQPPTTSTSAAAPLTTTTTSVELNALKTG
ncbi:uncharacterized protein LOC115632662 [Scaptodrosophila lebanonensis]|uniref:Uncharacterized protein LOC115632662 n=1 Tax=Drosophila lebanonensis TaxID=7225 RepID=A0A6J2UCF8_DROLE|nr:uncharacterized protein LOC115632662 [Scaptodrosophila lebanonensis]